MHEERANLRCIMSGIEQGILASDILIAAVQGLAFAPAATSDDSIVCHDFDCEIRSIRDQLGIDAVDAFESALDLGRSVVSDLQTTNGGLNDLAQTRDVSHHGVPHPK